MFIIVVKDLGHSQSYLSKPRSGSDDCPEEEGKAWYPAGACDDASSPPSDTGEAVEASVPATGVEDDAKPDTDGAASPPEVPSKGGITTLGRPTGSGCGSPPSLPHPVPPSLSRSGPDRVGLVVRVWGALRGSDGSCRPSEGLKNADAVCAVVSAAASVLLDGGPGLEPVRRCVRLGGGASVGRVPEVTLSELPSGEGIKKKRERGGLWRGDWSLAVGEGERGLGTGESIKGGVEDLGDGLEVGAGEASLLLVLILPPTFRVESLLLPLFCRRCCSSCSANERRMASMTISCARFSLCTNVESLTYFFQILSTKSTKSNRS
jgi:hypothetical protein